MKTEINKASTVIVTGVLRDILYHPMDCNQSIRELHRLVIGDHAFGQINYCQSLRGAIEGCDGRYVEVALFVSGGTHNLVAIKDCEANIHHVESQLHYQNARKIGLVLAGLTVSCAMPITQYLGGVAGLLYSVTASICVGNYFRLNVIHRKVARNHVN